MDSIFQEFKNSIVDSTICLICLEPITKAVMCPECKRFCCEECISRWIDINGRCPQCRRKLNKKELLHIKFIDVLAQYTKKLGLDTSLFPMCSLHNEIEKFVCLDCHKSFCSDCLIFGNHNTTHLVCQKKDLQNPLYGQLTEYLSKLNEHDDFLSSTLEEKIQNRIKTLKQEKEETLNFLSNLGIGINQRYNEYISSLEMFAKDMIHEKKSLNTLKTSVRNTLKDFLTKNKSEADVSDETEAMQKKIDSSIQLVTNRINYLNYSFSPIEITPLPVVLSYQIPKMKQLLMDSKTKDIPVTSPLIKVNFLTWQILFYPNGYGNEKGKNISVFFGLKEGEKDLIYTYTYSIELINVKNGNNFKTTDISFDFKNGGNYTGISNLYSINNLLKNGFISDDGILSIKIYLKPNNFRVELLSYFKQLSKSEFEKKTTTHPLVTKIV